MLGDYDGDGKMEVFMTVAGTPVVVDGNGQMLTRTNSGNQSLPFYYAGGLLLNNPVVADVDGDGQLELIAHNSRLYVWDLSLIHISTIIPRYRDLFARVLNS